MKEKVLIKEVEFLGTNYRICHYLDSNTIEFSKNVKKKFGGYKWEIIYFGHINLLEEIVKFHKQNE